MPIDPKQLEAFSAVEKPVATQQLTKARRTKPTAIGTLRTGRGIRIGSGRFADLRDDLDKKEE